MNDNLKNVIKMKDLEKKNYEKAQDIKNDTLILGKNHFLTEGNERENEDLNSNHSRSQGLRCIIPDQKKRAHSDSMLYSLNTACAINGSKYFSDSKREKHVEIVMDDLTSSTQNLKYDFCTWLSIANPSKGDKYEKLSDPLKSTSVHNKCLKLAGIPPSSPKKSPKDYWLLKHNSSCRHDFKNDDREVFTFEDGATSNGANQISRRTLTTIMDHSPESDESVQPGVVGVADIKLNNELQCLKHKKYLQNKYQQQSSSSMESDDVFFDPLDIFIINNSKEKDASNVSMDYTSRDSKGSTANTYSDENSNLKSNGRVTFTVFTFPPHKVHRDLCFSESESGLLSPAGRSSIASSPGVVSPPGTNDNSSPISVTLERFVLGTDPPTGQNNLLETGNELSAQYNAEVRDSSDGSLLMLSAPSDSHSKPCIISLKDGTYHGLTTRSSSPSSNACKYFTTPIVDKFLCSLPAMKVENEDGSQLPCLIQGDNEMNSHHTKLHMFPLANFQPTLFPAIKNKSILTGTISSPPSSTLDSLFPHSSAPDLLKDASVSDGSRNHVCQICDRVFSRSDMLSRHMRLHTGQRPYECRTCGQVFSRSDHLQTHLRTHTGEKPYRCSQCLYAAPRRDMVTRHMRVHARGKARKGKRGNNETPPSSPFHNYIVINDKCFAGSNQSEVFLEESGAKDCSPNSEISNTSHIAHSRVSDDQYNSEMIKSSVSPLTNNNEVSSDVFSLTNISSSSPQKYLDNRSDCHFPLDLSIQLHSSDQPNSNLKTLISHPSTHENVWRKLKITPKDKNNQNCSHVDVSLVKSLYITEDAPSFVTGDLMTRSDSMISIDSGVSYTTPNSLIQSIHSADSPEMFSSGRNSTCESAFFLWPTVVHGSPG